MPVSETMRLFGTINNHQVLILVDSGSTHNFIQSPIVKFLALPSSQITSMHVLVGNGTTMQCDTSCPQVPVVIQGNRFVMDFFAISLSDADLVLGIQWLRELGPITTDYTRLTMIFTQMGQPITLTADVPPSPVQLLPNKFDASSTLMVSRPCSNSPPCRPPLSNPTTLPYLPPSPPCSTNTPTSSKNPNPFHPLDQSPIIFIFYPKLPPSMSGPTDTPINKKLSSKNRSPPC